LTVSVIIIVYLAGQPMVNKVLDAAVSRQNRP
jgi:hypothetical protein